MKSKLLDIIKLDSEITRLIDEKRKIDEHILRYSQLLMLTFIELKSIKGDIERDIPHSILSRIRSSLNKLLKNPTISKEIENRLKCYKN